MPDRSRSNSASHGAPAWVKDAVFYQIFPDRFANGDPANDPPGVVPWGAAPTRDNFFGGDLQGIIDRLPYLEELGVTALYLTPIFKADMNHKYHTIDYLEIDPTFGTTELLRQLVTQAHNRGIRIVLDAVFNHCGWDFWAFEDVRRNGASSKYADWFFINSYPVRKEPPNYQTLNEVWDLPKLNTDNPEVREYLLKVATYWIEQCGIDGWRLDTPWKISLDFWRQFRDKVKRAKPDAYVVGEVWRYPRPWLQGDTCDGTMNYPLRDHIKTYCLRDGMDAEDFDYENGCLREDHGALAPYQFNLLGSHDTPRLLTLCGDDMDRAVLAVTFIFTYVGAPMIYYGDELGLRGAGDPECRGTMPWDEAEWEPRLHQTFRQLIRARHEHPALRSENIEKLWTFNGRYAYHRYYDEDEAIVVLNPRARLGQVEVPLPGTASEDGTWRDLLSGKVFDAHAGYLQIETLSAKTAYVLFPERKPDK